MLPLAYFDIRPFLFVGGLPLFIGIVLLARWMLGLKWKKGKVSLNSSLVFTALFALFLTGFGPFVDQKEIKEFEMTWTIAPTPSNGMKEAEVILKFAEFPQYSVGSYSDKSEIQSHFRLWEGSRLQFRGGRWASRLEVGMGIWQCKRVT
jgi:hypothetical protein